MEDMKKAGFTCIESAGPLPTRDKFPTQSVVTSGGLLPKPFSDPSLALLLGCS